MIPATTTAMLIQIGILYAEKLQIWKQIIESPHECSALVVNTVNCNSPANNMQIRTPPKKLASFFLLWWIKLFLIRILFLQLAAFLLNNTFKFINQLWIILAKKIHNSRNRIRMRNRQRTFNGLLTSKKLELFTTKSSRKMKNSCFFSCLTAPS